MSREYSDLTQHVVLTTPGTRMVVVLACAWTESETEEWKSEAEICPVVALETRVTNRYSKKIRQGDSYDPGITHDEMLEIGWRPWEHRLEHGALYVSPTDGNLASTIDRWNIEDHVIDRILVCPWPPEEDNQRLMGVILKMREDIIKSEKAKKVRAERKTGERNEGG